ncbi:MAG TPA: cofactor-independent phosphoglycerate mutase [Dehalococcoidia bacterium]|nr:cofactor-independent phosphoglycerate mutase [Dehalococcoidia bacterium]
MKYCVLIIDGAAGLPLTERGNQTCLELADTPNLDAMARKGTVGLVRTVPPGMEPSSACACLSILGYDPKVYYRWRASIEARSMGIAVTEGEAVFRCNLVAVRDGRMWDYSAGHISTGEAGELIRALEERLGNDRVHFYPGVSYRHLCKISGQAEILMAECTPPHDIPGRLVAEFLPRGPGSELLWELMARSEAVLQEHPVNAARRSRGETPATTIWLFWGSGPLPNMPPFQQSYGLRAALTSGVDLLRGIAQIIGMDVLEIPGVTDGMDNDYAAQGTGAMAALDKYDMVVSHIEAPDEAAHSGSIDDKIAAIQQVDREVVSLIRDWSGDDLRALILPDHPTPIKTRTHSADPVPFILWGSGFGASGANGYSETEARKTGIFIEEGYNIIQKLTGV